MWRTRTALSKNYTVVLIGRATSDAYASDVRADEATARDLGITGVPHFLINDKWSVPGAQDVETLVLTLDRAWERTEGLEQAAASA